MNVSGWPTVTGSIHEDFPWNSSPAFCPQLPALAATSSCVAVPPPMPLDAGGQVDSNWPGVCCPLIHMAIHVSLVSAAWCGNQEWSVLGWRLVCSLYSTFNIKSTPHAPRLKLWQQKKSPLDFLNWDFKMGLKRTQRAKDLPLSRILRTLHHLGLMKKQETMIPS